MIIPPINNSSTQFAAHPFPSLSRDRTRAESSSEVSHHRRVTTDASEPELRPNIFSAASAAPLYWKQQHPPTWNSINIYSSSTHCVVYENLPHQEQPQTNTESLPNYQPCSDTSTEPPSSGTQPPI